MYIYIYIVGCMDVRIRMMCVNVFMRMPSFDYVDLSVTCVSGQHRARVFFLRTSAFEDMYMQRGVETDKCTVYRYIKNSCIVQEQRQEILIRESLLKE